MPVLETPASVESRSDSAPTPLAELSRSYEAVRAWSRTLCAPLTTEDYVIQSMPDASPAKWHLAHTSWFFEKFLLEPNLPRYSSPHPQYDYLFNSYYNSLGERHCRPKRGLISRPTVDETYAYRSHVDAAMLELLTSRQAQSKADELMPLVELGLNHEQQHQELLVTDLKHMFSENVFAPVYRDWPSEVRDASAAIPPMQWRSYEAGLREIGLDSGSSEFFFDNEAPRHPEYVAPFAIGSRLVTNREHLAFMEDGGYEAPEYWLSEGWGVSQTRGWHAPMYWYKLGGEWKYFTLHGLIPINWDEPVCHVSLFEADAYAHWAGARLATEAEWETAAADTSLEGQYAESELFHPLVDSAASRNDGEGLTQMMGSLWQWTRSQYNPYPGYRQDAGALGEYNGKFMCNQFVLRGGSCATPRTHIRKTYRNFFSPDARWQFMGIRLAKDV